MKFSVLVNEGPYTHQASDSAYQFIRAALSAGHEIFRVFFYHDGVNNGTRLTTPPRMTGTSSIAGVSSRASTTLIWWSVWQRRSAGG